MRACPVESPCFFDGSGPIRCLASDAPENSTSDAPDIGKSGFSDFRKSGLSEIRKSGNLKIRIFIFPEIRIFGNRISEIPENATNQDFQVFRLCGFSENPKIRQKGIGCRICLCGSSPKKHGDHMQSGNSMCDGPSQDGCLDAKKLQCQDAAAVESTGIRCPGNRKIWIFRFPKIRIFGDSEVRKSENPDFRIPGNPDFRKSDF